VPQKTKPAFLKKSLLCRYIDRDERHGQRPSLGAFMPNPGDDHLSVNALELESRERVAEYYADLFGTEDDGKVAVCMHTVLEYNDSGKRRVQLGNFPRYMDRKRQHTDTGRLGALNNFRTVLGLTVAWSLSEHWRT
jgi:hypothetical protein